MNVTTSPLVLLLLLPGGFTGQKTIRPLDYSRIALQRSDVQNEMLRFVRIKRRLHRRSRELVATDAELTLHYSFTYVFIGVLDIMVLLNAAYDVSKHANHTKQRHTEFIWLSLSMMVDSDSIISATGTLGRNGFMFLTLSLYMLSA
jgi:hypothetical protein